MSGIFSSPDPPKPQKPPGPTSAEIAQAKERERRRQAAAKGRSSTVLGGSLSNQSEGQNRILGR